MKLDSAKVYRGGAGPKTKLIYSQPYSVGLDNEKLASINIRFKTNPYGERQTAFCIELGPESYQALLEMLSQNIAQKHPAYAAILKAIAADFQSQDKTQ